MQENCLKMSPSSLMPLTPFYLFFFWSWSSWYLSAIICHSFVSQCDCFRYIFFYQVCLFFIFFLGMGCYSFDIWARPRAYLARQRYQGEGSLWKQWSWMHWKSQPHPVGSPSVSFAFYWHVSWYRLISKSFASIQFSLSICVMMLQLL